LTSEERESMTSPSALPGEQKKSFNMGGISKEKPSNNTKRRDRHVKWAWGAFTACHEDHWLEGKEKKREGKLKGGLNKGKRRP